VIIIDQNILACIYKALIHCGLNTQCFNQDN